MSLDWSTVKSLSIPVGGVSRDVKRVSVGGVEVWRKLPYDAEVEYIESTGTQYVDTGVGVDTATDEIRASCQLVGTTNYRYIFGEFSSNGYFAVGKAASTMYMAYAGSITQHNLNLVTGSRHEFVADENGTKIDSTSLRTFSSFSANANVYLFSMNRPGYSADYRSASRIWSYRHWRNGVLVRDFIPVRVGSGANAVGYLYDRANPTGGPLGNGLYGNSGSGAFAVGPDAN